MDFGKNFSHKFRAVTIAVSPPSPPPNIGLVYYFTFTIVVRVHSQSSPLLIMPISNMECRVEVGTFNAKSKARYFKKTLRVAAPVSCFFSLGFRFVLMLRI